MPKKEKQKKIHNTAPEDMILNTQAEVSGTVEAETGNSQVGIGEGLGLSDDGAHQFPTENFSKPTLSPVNSLRSVSFPLVRGLTIPRKAALAVVSLVLLVSGSLFLGRYYINNTNNARVLGTSVEVDPAEKARRDAKELVEKIGNMVILPETEQPSIATVVDLEPLAGQPFFEKARVGDKTLVYQSSGKAYLFRPSEGKIVEFGLFQPVLSKESMLLVEIRNGSSVSGMASKLKEHLAQFGKYEFSAVGNASKKFDRGLVVDLSLGKKSESVKALAEYLKFPVQFSLPAGEKSSKAEVLILIGEH
ncbi:MAG: LytR C-terminal domain-containing protein [Candidatus Doudnabacteria bacterium]|nr:LytR C-terminal domain-containing protein [Candidatus Doudnabacteria bacterium]